MILQAFKPLLIPYRAFTENRMMEPYSTLRLKGTSFMTLEVKTKNAAPLKALSFLTLRP